MKFKTIKIEYSHVQNKYIAWVQELPGDREDVESSPSKMGFYHYPVTKSDQEAFKELQNCMIENAFNTIKKLEENIQMLQDIELYC